MKTRTQIPLICLGLVAATPVMGAQAVLEEVRVTAQKREQNLQDTAISLSAFNDAELRKLNVQDLENISNFTPNLRITSVASDASTASVAMRGTFNRNPTDPSSENTVGLYLDGVYVGKSNGTLMELGDLERVEVLRGPQGTLYGKNTIGGAINVITREPGEEFAARLTAGGGNESLFYSKGGITLPAIGTPGEGVGRLRSRVSFLTRDRNGTVKNQPTDIEPLFGTPSNPPGGSDEFNNIDRWGASATLNWDISEDLTLGYRYDHSDIDQNGVYSQVTFVGPGNFAFLAPYANPDRQSTGSLDYQESFDSVEIDGHALHADWHVGDLGILGDVSIKSISAWREVDSEQAYDLDGTNVSVLHFTRAYDYQQFSQELQFLGTSQSLDYVVGLYYFDEDADYVSHDQVFGAFGMPMRGNDTSIDNDSQAVYAQFDWRPIDRLTLTLGGRYSDEHKEAVRSSTEAGVDVIPRTRLPDLDFDEDTYLASIGWDFSDTVSSYLKFSQGYRSGSYDGQSRDPATFDIATDPEYLDAWELGVKSRWLEQRLQVNAAVFFSEYDDMLISTWDPDANTTRTQNAGEGEIMGLELEVLAQVSENLRLTMSYGYLDGDWKKYPGAEVDPETGAETPVELKNVAKFPQAPENDISLAVDYSIPARDWGLLNLHVDYSYTDSLYIVPLATDGLSKPIPQSRVKQREVVNARVALTEMPVGLGADGSGLEVALWAKNLFDEEVARSKFDPGNAVIVEWEDPLTYGVEVTLRY